MEACLEGNGNAMEFVGKRRPSDIVYGFYLLAHPIPVLFHLVAVALFALLSAWPHVLWSTFVLLIAAHTAMQLSIAVLNDYCDRRLDAESRKDKPIPRGLVRPVEALVLGVFCSVLMVVLLLPLNLFALGISILYLACGLGYNLGLKSTPLSGVVFALAIPLIPVYAFVGMGQVIPLIFWLVPIAALLGITLNLANSLPDLEEDQAAHARTLAVVLGVRGTFLACPVLIVLSVVLIGLLTITHLVVAHSGILVPTLLIVCLGIVLMGWLFGPQKPLHTRKQYFYLVVMVCLVLAGGWLISVVV